MNRSRLLCQKSETFIYLALYLCARHHGMNTGNEWIDRKQHGKHIRQCLLQLPTLNEGD
jgi:hypothetical protein